MHLIQLCMLLQLIWMYNSSKVFATAKASEPDQPPSPLQQQPKKETTPKMMKTTVSTEKPPPKASIPASASLSKSPKDKNKAQFSTSTGKNLSLVRRKLPLKEKDKKQEPVGIVGQVMGSLNGVFDYVVKGKKVGGENYREFREDTTSLDDLTGEEQRPPCYTNKDFKKHEAENKSIREKYSPPPWPPWERLPPFKAPNLKFIRRDRYGDIFEYYTSKNGPPHVVKLYYDYSSESFLRHVYMYTSIQDALQRKGTEIESKYNASYKTRIRLKKAPSSYFLKVLGRMPKRILTNKNGALIQCLFDTRSRIYSDGLLYESCNGGTLYSYNRSMRKKIGWNLIPGAFEFIRATIYQILEALMILHEMGFTHFNLTPDNIYVQRLKNFDYKEWHASITPKQRFDYFMSLFTIKLTGFESGLHYDSEIARFTSIRKNSGFSITDTLYRSPESFMGSTNLGPKADLWSAGLIFTEFSEIESMFKPAEKVLQKRGKLGFGRTIFYCMIAAFCGEYGGFSYFPLFPSYEDFGGLDVFPNIEYYHYFKHRYEVFWNYIKNVVILTHRDERNNLINSIDWHVYYGYTRSAGSRGPWSFIDMGSVAVDLIRGLTDSNPNKRISAENGLKHEFFSDVVEHL